MTPVTPQRLQRLLSKCADALERQAGHIEELGCTCATNEQRNSYHAKNRRRRDSRCTGVALAVEHRQLVRRSRQAAAARTSYNDGGLA